MTLAVPTSQLAELVQKFIDDFESKNHVDPPDEAGVFGILTPRQYLEEQGIQPRIIWMILNGKTQWTTLIGRAERILIAINRIEAFHTGELDVFDVDLATGKIRDGKAPNPKKRPPIPPNKPAKKCPGLFCQGQLRPLEEFPLRGRNTDKRLAQCRECHRYRQRLYYRTYRLRKAAKLSAIWERSNRKRRTKHAWDWEYYGLVPTRKVSKAIEIVCDRLGPKEVSRRAGLSYQMLWRYRTGRSRTIHKQHAAAILRLAYELIRTGEKWSFDDRHYGYGVRRSFVRNELGHIKSWRIIRE